MNWNIICFDLDNTLLDYEAAFQKAMIHCFKYFCENHWELSKGIDVHEWFVIFKKNCDELFSLVEKKQSTKDEYQQLRFLKTMNHFGFSFQPNQADEFQQYFYSVVHQFVDPYPGVFSMIRAFKDKGVNLGIITNGHATTQKKKIYNIGLHRLLRPKHIFISQELGISKPNKDIFNIAKNKLSDKNDIKSLYIGDSWELDVVGAIRAEWDAVYLNTRNEKPTTKERPVVSCSSIIEVKKRILEFL